MSILICFEPSDQAGHCTRRGSKGPRAAGRAPWRPTCRRPASGSEPTARLDGSSQLMSEFATLQRGAGRPRIAHSCRNAVAAAAMASRAAAKVPGMLKNP
jgi:hypothetical protein